MQCEVLYLSHRTDSLCYPYYSAPVTLEEMEPQEVDHSFKVKNLTIYIESRIHPGMLSPHSDEKHCSGHDVRCI